MLIVFRLFLLLLEEGSRKTGLLDALARKRRILWILGLRSMRASLCHCARPSGLLFVESLAPRSSTKAF